MVVREVVPSNGDEVLHVHYTKALRLLALDDLASTTFPDAEDLVGSVDAKAMALARIAALVAAKGCPQSYGSVVSAATEAGASSEEVVGVLIAITGVVGSAAVTAAAAGVALALGYDVDRALEAPTWLPEE